MYQTQAFWLPSPLTLEQSLTLELANGLNPIPESPSEEDDYLSFREFIRQASPGFKFYPHVEKLIECLERVINGEIDRLMIFMPPRHTKSELVSRLFTAYYLYRFPEKWVGLNSYGANLAYSLSRNARANYERVSGEIRGDAKAVEQWETGQGGGLWAAGVGGAITGKGFHLGIIDDPVKNAEEAISPTIREKHTDWYASTFYTRGEPGAAIIVIQTRWHEGDLSGWLLTQENDEEPEHWHIINFPAIAERKQQPFPETCTVEPDFREVGEALCPERYDLRKLAKLAKRVGTYFWNALFQQRPTPPEGGMFKRQWFEIVKVSPHYADRVRYWDKAGTEGGKGAYTCGTLMSYDGRGGFFVEDVIRGRWSALEREQIIKQAAVADDARYGQVSVWQEQEPGSGGKESAEATARNLAGHVIRTERVTGDKVTRAQPYAAQCEARNVRLVEGAWNAAYLEEMASFPYGAYKDQVDSSSGAFNKLAAGIGMSDDEFAEMFKMQQG